MGKISVKRLAVTARHGVFGFEKEQAQRFLFSADLTVDFRAAAEADDVGLTVSYADVCETIESVAQNHCFDLIETLATECVYALMDKFPRISKTALTVEKPDAPLRWQTESVSVSVGAERERAFLSLGSSLGDREGFLRFALKSLDETRGVTVTKVSSFLETEPYGGVAENRFLNCAAEIRTYLTPHALLDVLHRIEAAAARDRTVRWSDRTLDIDIVFFGRREVYDDDLVIPHPDWYNRGFVVVPLQEIAPEFVCPVKNVKLKNLRAEKDG